jgi:hypothetical protein
LTCVRGLALKSSRNEVLDPSASILAARALNATWYLTASAMLRRRSAASREPSIIHHRTPVCSEFARIVRPARLRKPEGEDLRRENSRNALVVERQVLTRSATPAPISARLFKPLGSVAMQFRICRTKETKCKRHVDTLAERRSAGRYVPRPNRLGMQNWRVVHAGREALFQR